MITLQTKYHQSNTQIAHDDLHVVASKEDISNFGSLYDKYYVSIYRFIFNRVNDEDIADDICSQTFLKAMQNIHKYESKGLPFGAWLFRIASNEVMQHFRNVKKELIIQTDDDQINRVAIDLETETPYSDWLPQLSKALETLNPEELALLQHRYFDELSYKETADILGITEGNAKVKVFRLLQKLKSKIVKKKNISRTI